MSYNFTIVYNGIGSPDNKGNFMIDFSQHRKSLDIPEEFHIPGLPNNLYELSKKMDKYVSFSYQIRGTGSIAPNDCKNMRILSVTLTLENGKKVANNEPIITIFGPSRRETATFPWVNLSYIGSSPPKNMTSTGSCKIQPGGQCDCDFIEAGGWTEISFDLMVVVDINIRGFCEVEKGAELCLNYFQAAGITSNPTIYKMEAIYNNFLSINADGSAKFVNNGKNFKIPDNYILPGMPEDFTSLANFFSKYITFEYQIKASGYTSKIAGMQEDKLLYRVVLMNKNVIADNSLLVEVEGPQDQPVIVNSGFIPLPYSGNQAIYSIETSTSCLGACTDPFQINGGWSGVKIFLAIYASLDISSYCTDPNRNELLCKYFYNFISSNNISHFQSNIQQPLAYQPGYLKTNLSSYENVYCCGNAFWNNNQTSMIWAIVLVVIVIIATCIALAPRKCV